MKYRKIITTLFIFFAVFVCSSNLAINYKDWVVFVKTCQNEQFCVNFPTDPETRSIKPLNFDEDNRFWAASAEHEVIYCLEVMPKNNNDEYLDDYLKFLKNNSEIEIIDSSFSGERTNKILDISYFNIKNLLYGKTRLIMTKNNIYSLSTSYNEGEKEDHGYFIASFFVDF